MLAIVASCDLDESGTLPRNGLYLLFANGNRPDREAIRDFVRAHPNVSISFDPASRPTVRLVKREDGCPSDQALASPAPDWLELLCAGLTFDLEGFAPGPIVHAPAVNFSFDFDRSPPVRTFDALRVVPGRHLAGGESSLPVISGLLQMGRDIVQHFDTAQAVVWSPSRSVIGRRYFESTVTAWLGGGAFPALGMTAFQETIDSGLQSVGLDFFIGQELRIEPSLAVDKVAATRLGIRLVNQLLILGAISREELVIAPDGSRLMLKPSANGKFIRVQPA